MFYGIGDKIARFSYLVASYIIAILRLFMWCIILLVSGLQQILFTRSEICSVEVRRLPLRCDRDDMLSKMSYVEKLAIENPELVELADDEYIEDEENQEDDGEE